MYEKVLFNKSVLYFQYAPPLTDLDDISLDRLPNPPYKDAPKIERSVYYFWWAFLRENEGYIKCCEQGGVGEFAKLYADFKDIRSPDFFKWWRATGRELFREQGNKPIQTLLSAQDWIPDDESVLMVIPIKQDTEQLVAQFRKLIRIANEKIPQEISDKSSALYSVHQKPVLTALYTKLQVYRTRNQYPDLTLDQIADKLDIAQPVGHRAVLKGTKVTEDIKKPKRSMVSRYYREATNLIKNVGLGRFPDTTP